VPLRDLLQAKILAFHAEGLVRIAAPEDGLEVRLPTSCNVQEESSIVDLARGVAMRLAESHVVKPQFGKHFATLEVKVLDDEFAFQAAMEIPVRGYLRSGLKSKLARRLERQPK
jgi:hypothetical protein